MQDLRSSGRLFHSSGAAQEKALCLYVLSLYFGVTRRDLPEEGNVLQGLEQYYSTSYSSQCCLTCYDFVKGYEGDKWSKGGGWYYTRAYEDFKNMYPRISTGSPFDPWRMVEGDHHGKRTYSVSCRDELKPLQPTAVTQLIGRPSEPDDEEESIV